MVDKVVVPKSGAKGVWTVYLAALMAAAILLADAFGYAPLQRITAGLGLALLVSVVSLLATGAKPLGWTATVIVWAAVVISWLW